MYTPRAYFKHPSYITTLADYMSSIKKIMYLLHNNHSKNFDSQVFALSHPHPHKRITHLRHLCILGTLNHC